MDLSLYSACSQQEPQDDPMCMCPMVAYMWRRMDRIARVRLSGLLALRQGAGTFQKTQ